MADKAQVKKDLTVRSPILPLQTPVWNGDPFQTKCGAQRQHQESQSTRNDCCDALAFPPGAHSGSTKTFSFSGLLLNCVRGLQKFLIAVHNLAPAQLENEF